VGRCWVRYGLLADADYHTGEYAIMVRSDLKGEGLGWALMQIMIDYARWQGLARIEGQVLRGKHHHAVHVPRAWIFADA